MPLALIWWVLPILGEVLETVEGTGEEKRAAERREGQGRMR